MYIQNSDRFLLVCPAMSSLHVSPHCQPRIWGQYGFPNACGWKAARVVCRVEASLRISHFQDLTVKFLVLLLVCCLIQQRWPPQTCCWHCCWTAYFHIGLQINWASLTMMESQPVVQGEPPPWPPGKDGSGPSQQSHRLPLFLPEFQQCFMNKWFLICYLTLVDCQIPEMVVFWRGRFQVLPIKAT